MPGRRRCINVCNDFFQAAVVRAHQLNLHTPTLAYTLNTENYMVKLPGPPGQIFELVLSSEDYFFERLYASHCRSLRDETLDA